MTNAYLIYCRAGFEKEATAELQYFATQYDWQGYVKSKADSAFVLFCGQDLPTTGKQAPQWRDLVFARQLLFLKHSEPLKLNAEDRISPLIEACDGQFYQDVVFEGADTNDGKSLAGFFKSFAPAFTSVLKKRTLLRKKAEQRLHLFFLDSTTVYIGYSQMNNSSPWPMGVPRLRFPKDAPSRSTLKLEEAFHYYLDEQTQQEWLREGMTGVDLGAAPGGWTWQLVDRSLQVTAIDNGPMDKALIQSGQVEHLKVDGFKYRPERPVTWLVCDMIESPARVAQTIASWIADGDAQKAIFNLKLPMKKRFEELLHCQDLMDGILSAKNVNYRLAFKQLYHDREEVTGYLYRC
ncbi:23S rRNA (cytidine(2498)-2'-O)-methyltransferase RlmM [uncultured Agitococcus sp.]|uniref:23S rRNA (cytidine(2498)-2'-O)-methyltransferase RlmM n=1 Tax=uncultured Agitococcus sp. TaxID=1506599 RepID=UPI002637F4E5|nr:23S rRNA (cytidine(2498)-2'-O)-methyltransferase RlmM [uncultured Agitococcus sp.]